jgi:hemolysin III
VSHRIAFYVTLVAGPFLVAAASDRRAMVATTIYVTLLAGMFGTSATLHRADWPPRVYASLRRADHAMICAFTAGTYTPFCMLGVRTPAGAKLLALAWAAAGLGILRAVLWPHAPRLVSVPLYILGGWVAVAYLPEIRASMEPHAFALMIAGGLWFTIGAVVYSLRWPDPSPRVFGYHEVFHVATIVGCACHFAAVAIVAVS